MACPPPQALSAFMYFSNSNRDKVKADNPGISFGEVGRALGERWKGLSAEDKAPYERQAAKDKERYAEAMRVYKGGAAGGAVKEEEEEDWGAGVEED